MIDVQWRTFNNSSNFSDPDLDMTTPNFRVAAGCDYEVSYTVFCGAGDPLGNPPNVGALRPGCTGGVNDYQPNETFRAEFWSARSGNQCSGQRLAYFDVPDHFDDEHNPNDPLEYTTPDPITVANEVTGEGNSVPIACMQMISGCQVTGHVDTDQADNLEREGLCPAARYNSPGIEDSPWDNNAFSFSSAYWHAFTWFEHAPPSP